MAASCFEGFLRGKGAARGVFRGYLAARFCVCQHVLSSQRRTLAVPFGPIRPRWPVVLRTRYAHIVPIKGSCVPRTHRTARTSTYCQRDGRRRTGRRRTNSPEYLRDLTWVLPETSPGSSPETSTHLRTRSASRGTRCQLSRTGVRLAVRHAR